MKAVITKNDFVLIELADTIEYVDWGGKKTSNDNTYFNYDGYLDFVNVVHPVPSEVNPNKFCYNPASGFFENPNYEEPISLEDRTRNAEAKAKALEERLADVERLLADMILS